MGAWIDFTSRLHISFSTNGLIHSTDYREITEDFISAAVDNKKLKCIQVDEMLPDEAFQKIDRILASRPDIAFRVFGLYGGKFFDWSILKRMPHLQRLQLDAHLANHPDLVDCSVLCEIPSLRSLHLNLFDLKDYSFIQGLPAEMEDVSIFADGLKGSVIFDCKWLLSYPNIHTLYLGKNAKKNIKEIAKLPNLKRLSLRGIKLSDLDFLRPVGLDSFSLLWCGMNDLSSLAGFDTLKELELWRILKLEDITFVSSLRNLEVLKLQDLNRITALPDLSQLYNLRKIVLMNMPIDEESVALELRKLITHRD